MHTYTFQLQGMSCASCVGRVEKTLLGRPDIMSAQVNLASETAQVKTESDNPDQIAQVLTNAGYAAELRSAATTSTADRKGGEAKAIQRRTLIAALLTLPIFLVEMGSHFIPGVHELVGQTIGHQTSRVLQFLLTTVVLFGPGRHFLRRACQPC